ncbi:MAG TPA: BatA domain-containing protein [Gemmatimonadales bacterium]
MNPLAFLVPAFLAGMAALAIPVLVHLRHRERKEPVRFPSLMFLRRIPFREVRRQQIQHWPLFLLRVLVVTLLVLAFARPFLRGGDTPLVAPGAQGREVAILLDRSASMGYGSRWARAQAAARQTLEGLGRDDRAALVLFDEQAAVVARPGSDRALVRAAIDGATPGSATTRYGPALRAAAELLGGTHLPRREAVVVSDFQRTGWRGEDLDPLPEGTVLRRVDVAGGPAPNLAVIGAEVTPTGTGGRAGIAVRTRVAATGLSRPLSTQASLLINGRVVQARDLSVPGDGVVAVVFDPVEVPPGNARGEVRLQPADSLLLDDTYRFVATGERPLRVLLIQNEASTPFLTRALEISRAPRVELTTRSLLRVPDLATTDAVFLDNVPFPVGDAGRRLGGFVREGGGLIISLGGNAGGWPQALIPARIGATVDRVPAGARLGALRREHPLFEPFRGPRSGDFGATRVWRFRQLDADSLDVLARYDDGSAALAESRLGRGRILLWSSALDNVWSDLPLQPVFLPLVHQLALYAAGYVERSPAWAVGEVASLGGEQLDNRQGAVVVQSPSGERVRREVSAGVLAIALNEGGFWEVREAGSGGRLLATLAANVPAEEARLEWFDPADLRLATGAVDSLGSGPAPGDLTPQETERRQGLWWYVLAAVVLLLGAETLVANRRPGMVRVPVQQGGRG